jgi:hypothetical protein
MLCAFARIKNGPRRNLWAKSTAVFSVAVDCGAFWQGGSPAIYPGDVQVEFLAKVDGCVVEALVRGCGPQVELVSCRSALETVIRVLAEICR